MCIDTKNKTKTKNTGIASTFLQIKMAHMTNPLATAEQLYQRNDLSLLPNDLQDVIYYMTHGLTQAAGVLLQLPQSITAQANVVLARYWLAESRPLMTDEFSVSNSPTYTYGPPAGKPTLTTRRMYLQPAYSSSQSWVHAHALHEISATSTPTFCPAPHLSCTTSQATQHRHHHPPTTQPRTTSASQTTSISTRAFSLSKAASSTRCPSTRTSRFHTRLP